MRLICSVVLMSRDLSTITRSGAEPEAGQTETEEWSRRRQAAWVPEALEPRAVGAALRPGQPAERTPAVEMIRRPQRKMSCEASSCDSPPAEENVLCTLKRGPKLLPTTLGSSPFSQATGDGLFLSPCKRLRCGLAEGGGFSVFCCFNWTERQPGAEPLPTVPLYTDLALAASTYPECVSSGLRRES